MRQPSLGRPVRAVVAASAVLLLAACTAAQSAPTQPSTGSASTADAAHTTAPTTPTPTPVSTFDRSAHSLDDPTSIWVVVDKKRPLQPKTYVPADLVTPDVPHTNVPQLRQVAADALVTMFAAAKRDGITLVSLSAYRSYATQTSIFDRNLRQLGRETTLGLTARPGYSEHQTGLADDLGDGSSCDLAVCFESHPAAKWLAANSWRYGWILRYPLGYTKITGIQTEPWHFRYIGVPAATEMHDTDVKTLEQFFGLPDSPDY
ncbi:M15 family metallopeptidase [Amnibacterium kyonggiense]|uniref:M15 family metallopeptidase n=1 Tax=Amnibacterium kyonggiense TaxID=595671 RepID=UPI00105BA127|nr:M15 family metallopeptidase [Amnibacterium kyonggiense]